MWYGQLSLNSTQLNTQLSCVIDDPYLTIDLSLLVRNSLSASVRHAPNLITLPELPVQ